MLSRGGPLADGAGLVLRAEIGGFRAIFSTEDGVCVRSKTWLEHAEALPGLRQLLPPGLVLDGELVAWRKSEPYFPLVCSRVLDRDMWVPVTLVIFDLLWTTATTSRGGRPSASAGDCLKISISAGQPGRPQTPSTTAPRFFTAVCGLGFEEVVAKKLTSRYRPNDRAWIKVKNPNYWRRDADERPCAEARASRANSRSDIAHKMWKGLSRRGTRRRRGHEHAVGSSRRCRVRTSGGRGRRGRRRGGRR